MADIPEHILRRSAEARAKAEGRPVEEILAEMKGEQPTPPAEAAAPAPAAPSGEAAKIPEALLRRTAEARAKKEGRSVEDVMAELTGQTAAAATPPAAAAEPAPAEAPAAPSGEAAKIPEALLRRTAEARAKKEGRSVEDVMAELTGQTAAAATPPAAAAEPTPAEAPAAAPAASGPVRDLAAESEKYGVPTDLLQRAMLARARKDGTAAPQIAGQAAPAPTAAAPAAAGAAAAPAVAAVPEGVRTQRLLTVVKAGAIQQVKSEPTDKVNVWPHLLAIEFVALMVVLGGLIVFSTFVDAPLLEFANFNEQPNPSKAPWYFLGLQELLSYFDPQVAGVIIPGFGLAGLAIIPYIDRNPSVRPSDRKLAIMIFTFFVMAAGILTIFGSFFRGPGFNFTFPWVDGLFFDF